MSTMAEKRTRSYKGRIGWVDKNWGAMGHREKLRGNRENMIWGRENSKNCVEKKYNGYISMLNS